LNPGPPIALLLLVATCPPAEPPPHIEAQPGLSVHVLDVGQADALLVIGPPPDRRTLLIDAGEVQGGDGANHQRITARIEQLTGQRSLDYLMLSHFHGDHTGFQRNGAGEPSGAFGLLDGDRPVRVGTLIDRGDGEQQFRGDRTRAHRDVIRAAPRWLEEGRIARREAAVPGVTRIDLGPGVAVEVLASAGRVHADDPGALAFSTERSRPTRASENDFSIALEITVGDCEFFTGGDLNGAPHPGDKVPYPHRTPRFFGETFNNVEGWMVARWWHVGRESDVEVYRANHHGSRYSSTDSLLEALDPEWILYSTGGQYGHPTRDVVERGARTAQQLVTSGVSPTTWPRGMPPSLGRTVGEIAVHFAADGRSYRIDNQEHRCFSDAEEAAGADQQTRVGGTTPTATVDEEFRR
jgi:hypothetical protein